MNILYDLISNYCPKGVEFKEVKDVYQRIRGTPITAEKMREIDNVEGEIRIFAGGKTVINAFESEIPSANIVRVPAVLVQSRGVIDFIYYDKPFTFKNEMWAYTSDKLINVKFLFYVLKNNVKYFRDAASGMGSLPQISLPVTENFKIPIPPLRVQQEIVRILDIFTNLEAELKVELKARKKQYSFYTNSLFDFEKLNGSVEYSKIEDVCLAISSGGTPLTSIQDYYKGDIPWLRTQEVDFGEISETSMYISEEALNNSSAKWIPVNCVIVAMYGATAAKVAINKIPLTTNQACCNLSVNENIAHYKYVYYWLVINYENLKSLGQGSQSNLNARVIRDFLIPIPPLDIQQRIVKILDQFDTLVNDISQGLPAEIAARRKQYEYYRNKLLTFKEVSHESV